MPRRLVQFSLLATLLAPSAMSLAAEPEDPAPSATEVLQNVVATYQSLTSYRDRGVSVTQSTSGTGVPERRLEFETLFTRPGKLRFAWDDEYSGRPGKEHYVIWSDGTSAWSSFATTGNKPEGEKSLALAVCSATGLSVGAGHDIPRLLTNEVHGLRIDDLEDYNVTGEESIDGVRCVQLTAYYRSGAKSTVWVGRDDNLIRKIVTDHAGTEQVETRTGIVVNSDIGDSAFRE
jgi:outer membrane lipoprotein-sorting protein